MPGDRPKALILAAGRGSRMGVATERKPKCLTSFLGYSLLAWQKSALMSADISEIGIVDGYQADQIQHNGPRFHNDRWDHSNMVYSLFCGRQYLQNSHTVVSYSDIVYQGEIVSELLDCSADIAIAYDPNWLELWSRRFVDPLCDAETFRLSETEDLVAIGEKPVNLAEVQGQYMGLLKFSPTGWSQIKSYLCEIGESRCLGLDMTTLLQNLVKANVPIKCVRNSKAWCEIDSLEDLACYLELNRSGKLDFTDAARELDLHLSESVQ